MGGGRTSKVEAIPTAQARDATGLGRGRGGERCWIQSVCSRERVGRGRAPGESGALLCGCRYHFLRWEDGIAGRASLSSLWALLHQDAVRPACQWRRGSGAPGRVQSWGGASRVSVWRWCRQTGVLGLWGRGPARLSRLRRTNTGEVALVYENDPDTRPPQQSAWTEAMLRVPGGPQASVGLPQVSVYP